MSILIFYCRFSVAVVLFTFLAIRAEAQNAAVRGEIYDAQTGEPLPFALLILNPGTQVAYSDAAGQFQWTGLQPGDYKITAQTIGYDSLSISVLLTNAGQTIFKRIAMNPNAIQLAGLELSAKRFSDPNTASVARLAVTRSDIKAIPSVGDADIAQYLTAQAGVVTTGSQGGGLYIRGGSPEQNLILLDGLPVMQVFHSLNLFSTLETELIQQTDIYSAAYPANYGGRVSAVVDINTRSGNPLRHKTLVSASPFQGRVLLEGPILKRSEEGASLSYLLSGKYGWLDRVSPTIYPYAADTNLFSFIPSDTLSVASPPGLPYHFQDYYGKVTYQAGGGSQLELFGFRNWDTYDFRGLATGNWKNSGGAFHFTLLPSNSSLLVKGLVGYSAYASELSESGKEPRNSGLNQLTADLHFTYQGKDKQLDYGFGFKGISTDFSFRNDFGNRFMQADFSSELGAYASYRQVLGKWVLQPGFRLQYYASQPAVSPEPRLQLIWNFHPKWRWQAAAGYYSQLIVAAQNDLDVVNFFTGYLTAPEQNLLTPDNLTPKNRLQLARHASTSFEATFFDNLRITTTAYLKSFDQLIQINRNKIDATDPDYTLETGLAKGLDWDARWESKLWSAALVYALARVDRTDNTQTYPTVFDRRHSVNTLLAYHPKRWSFSVRWNLGSGFPFTQTQGFYPLQTFPQGLGTNWTQENPELGILLNETRNGGRLPWYHRLDAGVEYRIPVRKNHQILLGGSVSNAYNRANVFYVDRVSSRVVRELPILPSLRIEWQ